jgi:hypothetical protein
MTSLYPKSCHILTISNAIYAVGIHVSKDTLTGTAPCTELGEPTHKVATRAAKLLKEFDNIVEGGRGTIRRCGANASILQAFLSLDTSALSSRSSLRRTLRRRSTAQLGRQSIFPCHLTALSRPGKSAPIRSTFNASHSCSPFQPPLRDINYIPLECLAAYPNKLFCQCLHSSVPQSRNHGPIRS